MWSPHKQTGMAIPLRGPPWPRGHQQGMMEAAPCLCVLGDAHDKCVETAQNISSRQHPETRHCSQPRRGSRAGLSLF